MIVEQLRHRDLVRLSSTCKSCRAHFAPLVFHTIRFGNDEMTSDSALLATKTYGDHVRRLEFQYVADPEDVNDDEVPPLLESHALLPASRELLEGCATPKADVLSLSSRFNFLREGRHNDSDDLSDLLRDTEHPIETMNAEQRYRWRAVLNEAYRATAKNFKVRKLELLNMMAFAVSAFYTRRFGELLGRLTSATITFYSPGFFLADELDIPGYREFISRMPEVFFSRMHQLTYLELTAPWGFPLDGREPDAIIFPLRPGSLPLLQSLKLNHSFTCTELVQFIAAHAETLSSLTLVDCVSDYKDAAKQGYPKLSETWAFFFFQITTFRPPALVNLSIEYEDDAITEIYNEEDMLGSERQRIERIEADKLKISLVKDPEQKVFAYVGVDRLVSMIRNAFVNRAQATKLEDYYEYQRLMRLVKENAHRIARERNQSGAV
ncbi:hypothetical protein BBO_05149 [Beauveria brongniartii RCEF 3172]|uniref:F-box domain-containing protein n=1 Tax=Beauveria brongniartii RCEF 3172 TaxID=1081107 RepID=A0A167DJN4_9HYPO|nr:hypothetical protein BBO_05149 [Beauveria brongniartii RCEF 3172]